MNDTQQATDEDLLAQNRKLTKHNDELQQRVSALEAALADISDRKQTGQELRILNEILEQRVKERTGYLSLLHDVTTIANQADSIEQAYQETLEHVCQRMNWPVGHICTPHNRDLDCFADSGLWSLHPPERYKELLQASQETRFKRGEGVVGHVMATGKPQWFSDVTGHELCIRTRDVEVHGLKMAFLFPVMVGERVVAVLEFFSLKALTPDQALLDVGAQVGTQLGRVVERAQAQERLRKLSQAVEQSPNAVIITDKNGAIEYVNPAFSKITGFGAEQAIGRNPRIIKGEETSPELYSELWQTITSGRTWRGEFHNRKRDGTLYWDFAAITPIKDPAGKITHFLGIQTNITDRKQAEERARERDAELAHMARLSTMGEMASMLAHELNQPLTAIVGYTNGAARRLRSQKDVDQELLRVLDKTAEVAKQAAKIVDGIRKFIRKDKNVMQSVRINQVVREVLELVGAEARRREITIRTDLTPRMPAVEGDYIQLVQVLLNLVRNSIDATEAVKDGERVVSLSTVIDSGAREIEIIVQDTGVGLPIQDRSRMFDAFFTTKKKGLGLGLSISRTIMEAHGGRIWAAPGENCGAALHVVLPVQPSSRLIGTIT